MTRTVFTSGNRNPVTVHFDGQGKTHQSFKDECDINQIMAKWRRTGELNHLATVSPTYGDFSNADSYMAACNAVNKAQSDFDSLSSRIRDRMGNDPGRLLTFMADPANHDEAIALGLISKPATTPVVDKPPVPTPADSPPDPGPGPSPVSGGE